MHYYNSTIIISLGGSIVNPPTAQTDTNNEGHSIDIQFIKELYTTLLYLIEKKFRFIIVVGGGNTARSYQHSFTAVQDMIMQPNRAGPQKSHESATDRIGIAATRLNAQFIQEVFTRYAEEHIVFDPSADTIQYEKPLLIASGWKPGFSTDYIAIRLAQRFQVSCIINLSNTERIYTADPKIHNDALPLDTITWQKFLDMIGTTWKPGLHVPFDPVAAKLAHTLNLEVICANGTNMHNFCNIIEGNPFIGTRIHNELIGE